MVENTEKMDRKYTILDCESKFLNLFGYQVNGPDGSNRYQILDTENEEVGYIQYKKIQNKNIKKGASATYGYVMEINSDKIKCKRSRKENIYNDNYTFYLIKNGAEEPVELYLGENPSIIIWSKEQGYINFRIGKNQLYCDFKSKTKKHNFEDVLVLECGQYQKKYNYCLSFCDKDKDVVKDKETTTFDLSFEEKEKTDFPLTIKETYWKNNQITYENEFETNETLSTAIQKFETGKRSIFYFFNMMNEYLPFQKDLRTIFLEMVGNVDKEISLLLPDLKDTPCTRNWLQRALKRIKDIRF